VRDGVSGGAGRWRETGGNEKERNGGRGSQRKCDGGMEEGSHQVDVDSIGKHPLITGELTRSDYGICKIVVFFNHEFLPIFYS